MMQNIESNGITYSKGNRLISGLDASSLYKTREAEQMASWDKSRSLHPKPTVKTTEDMVAILEEACNLARKATDQLRLEI